MKWIEIPTPVGTVYGHVNEGWQFIQSFDRASKRYFLSAKPHTSLAPIGVLGEFDSIMEVEKAVREFIQSKAK